MKKAGLIAIAILAVSMTASAAIIDYQFGDSSGTELKQSVSGGSLTNNFNSNIAGIAQDGSSNMVFAPTVNGVGSSVSGMGLTSGTVTMQFRMDSWSMAAATSGAGFQINLKNSAGTTTKATWIKKNTTTQLQFVDSTSTKTTANDFAHASGTDGAIMKMDFDLDAGTLSTSWKMDSDTVWTSTTTGVPGLTDIASLSFWIPAAKDWNGTSSNMDYLTVVPEPAVLSLIALCGGGLLFIRRLVL
ncbi:hypothetical protein [Pontiella sulfatireligans]|uniref:PEP-CTERM protein-sorting domain-containing protein n=1 Tax=Pontiella sulfatireligans TaxID=2750658 RepID=A0A6C2UES2_9BACT|nr:hypothetical protein [Pontiella sulfatireligans]VGO18655.1 hypothetical protein SCARR_00708 [Pontiella sulfatireligans]